MNFLFTIIKAAPSLFIIALLLSILSHLRNKSTNSFEKSKRDFWEREQSANAVRKKDISNLPYITVPPPIMETARAHAASDSTDPAKGEYVTALEKLSSQKILNLNGKSNTDIKLEYGTANITALSEADTNYTELISIISRLGDSLYENGRYSEARKIFEYSTDIESDVLKSYKTLLDIYENTLSADDAKTASDALREKADKLESIRKSAILALFDKEENTEDTAEDTDNKKQKRKG